jgi:RNA-binding protein
MVFPARWRYNSVISRFPNGKSHQMSLSNKQKQFLKAKAHELKPIILLGGNGLTEGVMAEIDLALEHHELIKVKVPSIDREEKIAIMDAIVREAKAEKVQVIGHILVIYRPAKERKLVLPRG